MKILEFIPVIRKPEKPLEGIIYLENETENETLAHKIYRLKDYQADYYVYHHKDLVIETPELIEAQCERMRVDNVGVAGVIGTLCLFDSCTWWFPQRNVVTVGAIVLTQCLWMVVSWRFRTSSSLPTSITISDHGGTSMMWMHAFNA